MLTKLNASQIFRSYAALTRIPLSGQPSETAFFHVLQHLYSGSQRKSNMASTHSFSLHGQGLKLNTRADIEPHLKALRELKDVEEVHFGGNTLGVEASEALAEVLSTLKSLKVCSFLIIVPRYILNMIRSPTSRTSSLVGSSPRFLKPSQQYATR